eukprot:12712796-Alexandrium_andersonii.AAC.1
MDTGRMRSFGPAASTAGCCLYNTGNSSSASARSNSWKGSSEAASSAAKASRGGTMGIGPHVLEASCRKRRARGTP